MSSKNRGFARFAPDDTENRFGDTNENPDGLRAGTNAIFGNGDTQGDITSGGRQVAKPISISQIQPDPKQPRRQIPSVVRQRWSGEAATVRDLFRAWVDLFAEEVSRDAQDIEAVIEAILEGEEISPAEVYQGDKPDPKRTWGVIGGSLMAVVNLAAEIRRDGLTNPITVHRNPSPSPSPYTERGVFLIETGERRWLAFHLLHIFYPDSTAWAKIPAREVTQSSVWRQASENTARAPLNAIGMARQLAILLMNLYGEEHFTAFDEMVQPGMCDRAYYAQVSDGNRYRVPRGKGEQLVGAMGIKHPQQLRQYRDLLRLPDEVWTLADDLNWTENLIRTEIVQKAVNENGMIALAEYAANEAGYRVIDSGHTVAATTVSDADEAEFDDDEIDQEAAWHSEEDAIFGEQGASGEAGDADADDEEDDEPEIDSSLDYWQVKVLEFAYARAEGGKPWFAAKDSPASPERLNLMIEKHLLRGSSAYTNTDYNAAHYAIAGRGCAAIGRPFLPTPQPQSKPVSGGEFHSGNAGKGSTPPVQKNPDPAAEQERRELKLMEQIATLKNQFAFQAEKVAVEKILTAKGREQANGIINQMEAEMRKFRNRLNGK